MLDLMDELGRLGAQALVAACDDKKSSIPEGLIVDPAARPEFGDLQIASCLRLARPLGRKPRDLAAIVMAAVSAHPAIARAEIAGPGYVNLFLKESWLEERALSLFRDGDPGLRRAGEGQTVVIDFSSPNIAKPMHIAHIRSTIIGDALRRTFAAAGFRVIADNHLGDWGTQFGKLIVAYRTWLDREAYKRAPIAELVRLYQRFVSEEAAQAQALGVMKPARRPEMVEGEGDGEEDEAQKVTPLLAEARRELARLQAGDPENLALWREFVAVSMAEFERTYARLGVRFDVQLGESFYNDRLAALVEDLLSRGIAEHSQGAVICPVEGEPAPLLIRKRDGSYLYGTTDLATILHRVRTWSPSRILYVVGAPQQLHFRQVFHVARRMGVTCALEHVSFGTMRFRDPETGEWVSGSTRKGNVPLLDEFLDEAIRRAVSVARDKAPELGEAELREVARVVGLGAVRYNDLCRDRQGDIAFDMDKALSLEGNTAPYIQYAYARIRSIIRRFEAEGGVLGEGTRICIEAPAERALVRTLLGYPAAVEAVTRSARPHHLCEYLYGLAGTLSTFYNEVPVLKAEAQARASRIALLTVVGRTLRHGLGLLGIEVLERM